MYIYTCISLESTIINAQNYKNPRTISRFLLKKANKKGINKTKPGVLPGFSSNNDLKRPF
jgi:hypothetical protein